MAYKNGCTHINIEIKKKIICHCHKDYLYLIFTVMHWLGEGMLLYVARWQSSNSKTYYIIYQLPSLPRDTINLANLT